MSPTARSSTSAATRIAATSRSRTARGTCAAPSTTTRRRSIPCRLRTRSSSCSTSSCPSASSCDSNWRTCDDVFDEGGHQADRVDQVRPPEPGRDPPDVSDEDHHGGHLRRRRLPDRHGPDGLPPRRHRAGPALQDVRRQGRRLPRPLRPHRPRDARDPRRVREGHKKLLQATCRKCGRLLLTRQQAMEYMAEMEQVEELGGDVTDIGFVTKETAREAQKRQRCPHCGEKQGKITLDKPTTFREDGHKLTPKEVRERLERIPNEDLRVLGMNPEVARPEWMVLTALLVPPVTVRPSITLESGDRSEDDLTHKLVDVLRINQRLRENRDAGAPQLIVEDLWELLQYHVTTYFDNQTSGIPPARHRSGRPLKTLVQRLKGKEGRFRSNL